MKKNRLSGKGNNPPGIAFTFVLRIMKLTAILMLALCLQVSATAYSQTRITLSAKRMNLAKVLQAIEAQGHIRFVYNNDVLPNNEFISIDVTDQPLDIVLSKVLKNTDLTFKALDKELIVIAPGNKVIKNILVKGKITDVKGMPILGVNVQITGTGKGTVTGVDGTYQLEVPDDATLLFTFIGYVQEKIAVNGRTTIDMVMKEDTKGLNEVVVVGYGSQKKVNLTGSVATVSADKLISRPVTSVQNALQGLVPGLTVLNRPGNVGKDAGTITVRGRTNLSAPGPMIIIDGIPSTSNDMAAINPNDIENMSVLKDAASASIYGSRAANGVILITTKRGKEGKMMIDVNASYGSSSATRLPKYLGSADYARLFNEGKLNAGKPALYTDDQIKKFADGSDPDHYPNTDWYKLALRKNAPFKDIQVGVNGSSKNTTYYLSIGYQNQASLIPTTAQDRYTMRLNTSTQVLPIFNVGTNISLVKQDINNRGGDLNFTTLNRSVPTLVAVQSDGTWGTMNGGKADATLSNGNVLRTMQDGGRSWDKSNAFTGGINGTLTPLKGLSIKGLASLKLDNRTANRFTNTMPPMTDFDTKLPIASTAVLLNEMQEKWAQRQALLLQAYAEYEKTIKHHYAKIMVGASEESNVYRDVFVGRKNFPINGLGTVGAGSGSPDDISTGDNLTGLSPDGSTSQNPNGSYSESWAIRSYFGRLNYSFADKYLLEANMRFDLSSRFHPDYRLAEFPSVSAAWRISEENFMKNVNWVNNLKIRGSWGILGNESAVPVGNYYNYLESNIAYSFEGNPVNGIYQKTGSNLNTTWEKVYMTNVGLDATFLKGKLDATIDYYVKRTEGILLDKNAPAVYGLLPPRVNAGSTRNKGIELNLTYSDKIGKDFSYNISVNVSKIKNTIVNLGGDDNRVTGSYYIERVGQSVGSFYGYEVQGLLTADDIKNKYPLLYPNAKPGDIKYVDANGDGKIDGNDRRILGNDVPWLNYGANLGMSYKGFDLNVLTYGVSDVKVYFGQEASYAFFNGAGVKEYHLQRWTKDNPNPNAAYPRILIGGDATQNNTPISAFWLFNGAYFRIRSLSLGYTVPHIWVKKAAMQSARIYVAANNPFTFMSDKRLHDYDPEMASGRGSYPGVKTWVVGVNVKF
ncbi:TonB-linked SusC/RagA family outer membrane protein [Chitinophaga niastensis]|uniref:TonB-linked SusC/RagA family outer membrane protein n=1 Tax=Chitinophaga niastensis TaxID=536980 RepID=A0A2P8HRX7_CHINA|nr:TonB-dependent receptor [Chitinophaga niastensis]PSL48981.1 TonB-linked SusC/RagA family outer membrane protein [Chitinophaga niastensis]